MVVSILILSACILGFQLIRNDQSNLNTTGSLNMFFLIGYIMVDKRRFGN